MCRSRRELFNEYLLAKIGVDTAENEPLEVWGEDSIQYSLHSLEPRRNDSLRLALWVTLPPASTARNRFSETLYHFTVESLIRRATLNS